MSAKQAGMFKITFPPHSLFQNLENEPKAGTKEIKGQMCHQVSIGERTNAVSKYYKIETPVPSSYNEKWTFVAFNRGGKLMNFGADTIDNKMVVYVDQLGDFYTYKDIEAPTYQIVNLEANQKRPWKIIIKDNLIPDGRAADLHYRATVNDKWICMVYDLKNDILIFDDFEQLPKGDLDFELAIADAQGNSTILKRKILASNSN